VSTPKELETIEAAEDSDAAGAGTMKRRQFIRVAAAAAAATGGLGTGTLIAQEPPAGRGGAAGGRGGGAGGRGGGAGAPQQQAPPIPLHNGEHPALVFQAYPGGTGALMEKLIAERGAASFQRRPIETEPWSGPVPTSEVDLAFLPAHRLGALLRARHVSSVDLTRIYLERLHRFNDQLLAAVTILDGMAMEQAQQADADIRAGNIKSALHGVPWGVKDLFAVRGTPTTWGHEDFENQVFDFTSELVTRLENAGAVLLAKLATGSIAQGSGWFRGNTRNPWNPTAGSGGSSAGPGSATAAGLVGFSIGTETQGSITSPSSTCGISALRPTFGRVSRHGGMVLSWSMDKAGPMCRSLEDVAIVFSIIHGADPKDPATLTTPFEFRRLQNLNGIRIAHGPTEAEPMRAFLAELASMGATVKEVPNDALPGMPGSPLTVDTAAAFDFHWGEQAEAAAQGNGEAPPTRFTNGRDDTALDYINGQRRRLVAMKAFDEALQALDVDLFMVGGGATHTTGHPLVVLPYNFATGTQGGRGGAAPTPTPEQPRTVTVYGHLFQDDLLLSAMHAYQIRHDWHLRKPPLTS
jgi:Asp-tRNA(Asn)/Glu-tRNA(Gln) amidotransferase A subunit family amidase